MMCQEKMEIVQTVNRYEIIKFYANEENGHYGDIYTSKEDVLKDHPQAEIMEGYGFIDPTIGFCPDEAGDWYETIEEVEQAILSLPF